MPTITATAVRKRNRLGISMPCLRLGHGGINHFRAIQHVRTSLASLSGNRHAGGSLGGSETGGIRQSPNCKAMSETASQAAATTSPEADILAALGARLI